MDSVERLKVKIKPEIDVVEKRNALVAQVCQKRGPGWDFVGVEGEGENRKAIFERAVSISEVKQTETKITIKLNAAESKPSSGESVAAKYQDRYEGYYLTNFEPFLQRAEMTKLTEGAVRTRAAAAVALGCKPWDIKIATQSDGGYALKLPHTYMPSKHDDKLEEVTTTVAGRVGWRIEIDAPNLTARMIPGEPPLFPPAVKYPLDRLGPGNDVNKSLMGVTLPKEGVGIGDEIYLDWAAGAHIVLSGLPQSGKSVTINSLVAQQISSGAQIAIIDDKSKAVDFKWCKDFVRPGGWGCDSETQAVAVLAMIYEEGEKRAKVLDEYGVTNWFELPDDVRFQPITIFIDELSALLVLDP